MGRLVQVIESPPSGFISVWKQLLLAAIETFIILSWLVIFIDLKNPSLSGFYYSKVKVPVVHNLVFDKLLANSLAYPESRFVSLISRFPASEAMCQISTVGKMSESA